MARRKRNDKARAKVRLEAVWASCAAPGGHCTCEASEFTELLGRGSVLELALWKDGVPEGPVSVQAI